ncbi:MAG: hypothetical protein AABX60_02725, partial [Nanoarchaeota archaeon]
MAPPLVAVFGYGQGTKERPDIGSFRQGDLTGSLLERLSKINEGVLGTDLAQRVQTANPEDLGKDTHLAQLAVYADTMALFFSLLHFPSRDMPLIDRLRAEEFNFAVSGDSCWNVVAAYLPDQSETIAEQVAKYADGLVAVDEWGKAVARHPNEDGGLAVITRLGLEVVKGLCEDCNEHMKEVDETYHSKPKAKWVKANAPRIHGVTATREGLYYLTARVAEMTGRSDSFTFISPNRFHDPEAMKEASDEFGEFMKHHWVRRPSYVYISNRDGGIQRYGRQIKDDMVNAIMSPVNFNSGKDDSVVGKAKALGVNSAVVFNIEVATWLRRSGIRSLLMN